MKQKLHNSPLNWLRCFISYESSFLPLNKNIKVFSSHNCKFKSHNSNLFLKFWDNILQFCFYDVVCLRHILSHNLDFSQNPEIKSHVYKLRIVREISHNSQFKQDKKSQQPSLYFDSMAEMLSRLSHLNLLNTLPPGGLLPQTNTRDVWIHFGRVWRTVVSSGDVKRPQGEGRRA